MNKLSDYIKWARSLNVKELKHELITSFCPAIESFAHLEQARDCLARHCYDEYKFFATYYQS